MPRVQRTLESSTHGHVCVRCAYAWSCIEVLKKSGLCIVHEAAKVNKTGPFCDVCMYLIMAKRCAIHHNLSFPAFVALIGDFTDVE